LAMTFARERTSIKKPYRQKPYEPLSSYEGK